MRKNKTCYAQRIIKDIIHRENAMLKQCASVKCVIRKINSYHLPVDIFYIRFVPWHTSRGDPRNPTKRKSDRGKRAALVGRGVSDKQNKNKKNGARDYAAFRYANACHRRRRAGVLGRRRRLKIRSGGKIRIFRISFSDAILNNNNNNEDNSIILFIV